MAVILKDQTVLYEIILSLQTILGLKACSHWSRGDRPAAVSAMAFLKGQLLQGLDQYFATHFPVLNWSQSSCVHTVQQLMHSLNPEVV